MIQIVRCIVFSLISFGFVVGKLRAEDSLGGAGNGEEVQKASDALMDFVEARHRIPARAACMIRGELWYLADDREVPSHASVLMLWSQDRESNEYYVARGRKWIGNQPLFRSARWEQMLESKQVSFRRVGSGADFDKFVNLREKDASGKQPKRLEFDPFNIGIAGYGAIRNWNVKAAKAMEGYVLNAELIAAELDENEDLVGVWLQGLAVVELTFSQESGGMPTKMVRRMRRRGQDPLEARSNRIHEVAETEWRKHEHKEAVLWLPSKFRMISMFNPNRQTEQTLCLDWKIGIEAEIEYPDEMRTDWRKPFASAFGEELTFELDEEGCVAEGPQVPDR